MNPLDGLIVVSLEQAVAAPFATRQLADLGARVIKIERPGVGDFARGYDETVRGLASHFVWLNRSKESVALDLKSDHGRSAVAALVSRADVFVQNLAPGAAERLGLGAEALRADNPRLIHVSISGYGGDGPYADKKAYDLLVQCEAGLVSITGTQDEPSKVGISIADIASGMFAYSGILSALIQRGRTDEGVTIEISMLEALAEWMGYPLNYAMYGGTPPARTGARHAAIAPYGPFRCGDGEQVFLGLQNEREWATFCDRILGEPILAVDPRFIRNSSRVEHSAQLQAEIERSFSHSTAEEVAQRLEAAGIANALLRDMTGLANHPQLKARGRWLEYDSPAGTLRALVPPATFVGAKPVMGRVPEVGEHTDAVLAEFGALPSAGLTESRSQERAISMPHTHRGHAVQAARSFLFVPGDQPARFDKAVDSGADLVVIDLEDAVAGDRKDSARASAVEWLSRGGRACVRINDPSSPLYGSDLDALADVPGLVAVMLPKTDSPQSSTAVAERAGVPVIALIESADGMVRIHDIARTPAVARLAFGHLDYALDLGADPGWSAMLHARSSLVLASRAAGLPGPVDGVTTALDDAEVLDGDLRRTKEIGFTAKLLVHPKQVAVTHAAFRPDEEAVRWARRVVASAAGSSAARVDGHMVDAPVLARANAILQQAG